MIERLRESGGSAFGFKVSGHIGAADVKGFEPQIEHAIAERKHKPIGLLADVSEMEGADWGARWDEMRFLQKYTNHIARLSVVGAHKWEEIGALIITGAAVLQAETRYFESSELVHAWEWARGARIADQIPVRTISAGTGIWKDYQPEYMNL
jgi:hypothetical protein